MKLNLKNYWREIVIAGLIGVLIWVTSGAPEEHHTGSSETVCMPGDTIIKNIPAGQLVKYVKVRVPVEQEHGRIGISYGNEDRDWGRSTSEGELIKGDGGSLALGPGLFGWREGDMVYIINDQGELGVEGRERIKYSTPDLNSRAKKDTAWLYADIPVQEYRDSNYYARTIGWLDSLSIYKKPAELYLDENGQVVYNAGSRIGSNQESMKQKMTIFGNTCFSNGIVAPGMSLSKGKLQMGYNYNLINGHSIMTLGWRLR